MAATPGPSSRNRRDVVGQLSPLAMHGRQMASCETCESGTIDMSDSACSSNAPLVRQDEPMPWNVHQVAALPALVDEAFEVVKTRLRIQIAHYLADHPGAQIGEI